MKDPIKYSRLWRQKRDELKLDASQDQGWANMQNLLDQHMPVTPQVKSPVRPGFLKPWPIAGLMLLTAAVVYYFAHIAGTKKHSQHNDSVKHGIVINPAKALKSALPDSSVFNETGNIKNDSNGNKAFRSALTNSTTKIKTPGKADPANKASATINKLAKIPTNLPGNKLNSGVFNRNTQGNIINNYSNNGGLNNNININSHTVRLNGSGKNNNSAAQGNKPDQNNLISDSGNRSGDKSPYLGSKADTGQSRPDIVKNAADNQLSAKKNDSLNAINNHGSKQGASLQQPSPAVAINQPDSNNKNAGVVSDKPTSTAANKQSEKNIKDKKVKPINKLNTTPSKWDYGILAGVNSSGSFTPKSQNANIYGSFPVDSYTGLFAAYNFKDKWAINLQVRALSPQNISGSYTHANGSKVDSGKLLQVTDERKTYFVSVPLHLMYRITENLSVKAGPVINIPVKQINISNSLTPATLQKDTAYYKKITSQINAARYNQQINFGVSGGVSYQYKRLNMEATYLKSLTGYSVTSDFGNYKVNSGTLQFTIGIKLNRLKP